MQTLMSSQSQSYQYMSEQQRQAIQQNTTSIQQKKMTSTLQSDLSIPLIKYELVFDEKTDGYFLQQHVLSKQSQNEIIVIEEDEEEEEVRVDQLNKIKESDEDLY